MDIELTDIALEKVQEEMGGGCYDKSDQRAYGWGIFTDNTVEKNHFKKMRTP